jgi:multiple sugar transport system substrate-binding protein
MTRTHLSRRELLRISATGMAGLVAASCAPVAPAPQGATTEAPTQPAAATAAPPSAEEAINLRFWIWDDPQKGTEQARCDLTTKIKPNIKTTVEVYPWDEYWPKLQTVIAAGAPPDIMWMEPGEYMARAAKGIFVDLQPVVDASAEFSESLKGLYPANVANYLFKCRLHGAPRNAACVAIGYNEDLLAKEGLQPLAEIQDTWTWDTLREYAAKLTKMEGSRVTQWGYYGSDLGFHQWAPFLYSNDGSAIDRDTWKCVIGSPQSIQAFQFLTDLILVDKVAAPTEAAAEMGLAALFQTGKIAMMPIGSWEMKSLNAMEGLHYNVARIPMSPNTKKSQTHTIGLAGCVASAGKHIPEAAEVALRLFSVEAQRDIYGEEIPVRPEAAEIWSDPKVHPPSNRGIYLEETKTGRPLPVHPTVATSEFTKVIGDHLSLIYAGKEAVDAGLQTAEQQVNALIADAGEIPAGFEPCPDYLAS